MGSPPLDPFEEFLRRESSKVRARRIGAATFIEEEQPTRHHQLPTDFIDAFLLRAEPGEHVVVEKGFIRELRYRIEELEGEVRRLRRRNLALQAALVAAVTSLILVLIAR